MSLESVFVNLYNSCRWPHDLFSKLQGSKAQGQRHFKLINTIFHFGWVLKYCALKKNEINVLSMLVPKTAKLCRYLFSHLSPVMLPILWSSTSFEVQALHSCSKFKLCVTIWFDLFCQGPDAEELAMISIQLASRFLFSVGFHTKKTLR